MNFAVHYLFGLLEVPVLSCFCLLQYFAWYFLHFITEAMPTHFRNRKSEVRGEVISILRFPPVTEGNPAPQILAYRLNILSTNVTQGILLAQTWETHQVIAGYQHWIGFWSFEFQNLRSRSAMHVVQICSLRSVHMQIRNERAAWSPNYRRLMSSTLTSPFHVFL